MKGASLMLLSSVAVGTLAQTVKVPCVVEEPFVVASGTSCTGMLPDLIKEVLKRVDPALKPEFVLKKTIAEAADVLTEPAGVIAAVATTSRSSNPQFSYSAPYMSSGYSLLASRRASAPDMWRFVKPFSGRAWGTVFGVAALYAVAMWLADQLSPFGARKAGANKREHNFAMVTYRALISFFSKSMDNSAAWSSRLVNIAFFFFILFYGASYSAGLNALDVAASLNRGVTSFSDIQRDQLTFAIVANSSTEDWLRYNPSYAVRDLTSADANLLRTVDSIKEGVALMASESADARPSGFLGPTELIRYFGSAAPGCSVKVVGKPTALTFYSLMTSKNRTLDASFRSMNLLTRIDDQLTSLMQSGYVNSLATKHFAPLGACSLDEVAGTTIRSQVPQQQGGIWIVTAAVLGVSFLVFLIEHLVFSCRLRPGFSSLHVWMGGSPPPAPSFPADIAVKK